MFEDLGGCPRLIVPDNLKSGVLKASFYDPELNHSYAHMAHAYRAAANISATPAGIGDCDRVSSSISRWTSTGSHAVAKASGSTWTVARQRDRPADARQAQPVANLVQQHGALAPDNRDGVVVPRRGGEPAAHRLRHQPCVVGLQQRDGTVAPPCGLLGKATQPPPQLRKIAIPRRPPAGAAGGAMPRAEALPAWRSAVPTGGSAVTDPGQR
jgi:hypothetical protein